MDQTVTRERAVELRTGSYDGVVEREINSMDLVIAEYMKHVDQSLLAENLKKTVEERIQALEEFQKFTGELQAAVKRRNDEVR